MGHVVKYTNLTNTMTATNTISKPARGIQSRSKATNEPIKATMNAFFNVASLIPAKKPLSGEREQYQ